MLQSTEVAAKYRLLAERDYDVHEAAAVPAVATLLHIVPQICINPVCLFPAVLSACVHFKVRVQLRSRPPGGAITTQLS